MDDRQFRRLDSGDGSGWRCTRRGRSIKAWTIAHEASIAKLYGPNGEPRIDRVMQIHGHGYTREMPIERWYRDLRVTRIYEGTDEITFHHRQGFAQGVCERLGVGVGSCCLIMSTIVNDFGFNRQKNTQVCVSLT